jgi:hypothetical protein
MKLYAAADAALRRDAGTVDATLQLRSTGARRPVLASGGYSVFQKRAANVGPRGRRFVLQYGAECRHRRITAESDSNGCRRRRSATRERRFARAYLKRR